MEVHAHTHPIALGSHGKKNWKSYFWEFLMLFLAVFAGFLAENQREHFIEKARAKQYAKSLVNDLKKDTAMINRRLNAANRSVKRIQNLEDFLRDKPIEKIKNIDLFGKRIFMYDPYTWNRTTLEQLKNTGSIRYFTNDSIITRLNAYDAFTRHLDEDYTVDEEQLSKVLESKNLVCNQNYPREFIDAWNSNKDSLLKTDTYREMEKNGPQLMAHSIYDIEVFANEAMTLQSRLFSRSENELPRLIQDAEKLIIFLKNEYHLK